MLDRVRKISNPVRCAPLLDRFKMEKHLTGFEVFMVGFMLGLLVKPSVPQKH
jgi:hypothetical protein